jgi:microcystin-dependent protein
MDAQNLTRETTTIPFRNAFPIEFYLYNMDQQPVLYIDDVPDSLTLEIKNASSNTIHLISLENSPASSMNYHFELCFRPGTLDQNCLPIIAVRESTDWQISHEKHEDGITSLYLLSTNPFISLEPGLSLILMLDNITPSGFGGTHGTRVELKFQNLRYSGSSDSLNGSRLTHLALINHQGRKSIPLHVGFVGTNQILNNGRSTNELTLRITNVLKEDPAHPERSTILLRGKSDQYPQSELVFSFDCGNRNMDWALGTSSQVSNIVVQEKIEQGSSNTVAKVEQNRLTFENNILGILPVGAQFRLSVLGKPVTFLVDVKKTGDNQAEIIAANTEKQTIEDGDTVFYSTDLHYRKWITRRERQGEVPKWVLAPDETIKLGAGEFIQVTFESIISSLPNGRTNLYVDYHNIPGYWDGHFTVQFDKSPLVIKKGCVGIGTGSPNAKLDVAGTVRAKAFSGKSLAVDGTVKAGSFNGDSLTVSGAIQASSFSGDSLALTGTVKANSFSGDGAVPAGVIVMWHGIGAEVPKGWVLCDGQNGTPNLVDKFIMGAGGTDTPAGATGGESQVTLTEAQMPPHTHTASTDSGGIHDHFLGSRGFALPSGLVTVRGKGADGSLDDRDITSHSCDSHTHAITMNLSGGGEPHNNMPPFFALCFIMKQ